MEQLTGKVAIVTGSTAGVGRGIAYVLASHGARVAIVARRQEPIDDFVEQLTSEFGRGAALGVAADVSTAQGVENLVRQVHGDAGRIDILVNNAGRPAHRPFHDNDDREWQEDFDLKVMAAVRLSRQVYPIMKDGGGGRIINILSLAAKVFFENSTPTAITRAGGLALTKVLSREFASANVLVNAVLLGFARSDQHVRRWQAEGGEGTIEDFYAKLAKSYSIPLGRVVDPREVGELVSFLSSDRASYITGAAINCDGGLSPVP